MILPDSKPVLIWNFIRSKTPFLNKTKKFILSLLIFSTVTLFSNEEKRCSQVHQTMNYYSFGAGLPSLIYLNFGRRVQHNHHGFDVGFGGFPVFLAQIYGNYLNYPSPNPSKQYYWGGGIKLVCMHLHDYHFILPIYALVGKEFLTKGGNKHFFQLELGALYIRNREYFLYPYRLVQVAYGIKF